MYKKYIWHIHIYIYIFAPWLANRSVPYPAKNRRTFPTEGSLGSSERLGASRILASASSSVATKVKARPLVPKRPARPTRCLGRKALQRPTRAGGRRGGARERRRRAAGGPGEKMPPDRRCSPPNHAKQTYNMQKWVVLVWGFLQSKPSKGLPPPKKKRWCPLPAGAIGRE